MSFKVIGLEFATSNYFCKLTKTTYTTMKEKTPNLIPIQGDVNSEASEILEAWLLIHFLDLRPLVAGAESGSGAGLAARHPPWHPASARGWVRGVGRGVELGHDGVT